MALKAPHNEPELLAAIAAGDEQAFRIIFDAYRDKLYYYLLKMTDTPQQAQDLVQDVFLKVWAGREQLTEVKNFNAWLFRLSHNHALNGIKKMAKETLILSELGEYPSIQTNEAEELIILQEVRKKLQTAINDLPEQQQKIFLLSRQEGLKYEEIGKQLNISPLTVKKHMSQAVRRLRQELAGTGGISPIILFIILGIWDK